MPHTKVKTKDYKQCAREEYNFHKVYILVAGYWQWTSDQINMEVL